MRLVDTITVGGLKISRIGLGAWQAGFRSWGSGYTRDDVISAYRYAFEYGVNFIDTAEIYGNGVSEEVVREAIKGYDVVVATKVAGFNTSEYRIFKSAEMSRRRLGVDVIDLYQLHWPPSIYTSLCRVMRSLEKLVDKGVIRYIGVSNFDGDLLKKAMECMSKYEIVSNQVQYSLVYRVIERKGLDLMKENNIALIAYSPLGKGVLAGKRVVDNRARRFDYVFQKASKDDELIMSLKELSERYGVSMASIALRWVVEKGGIPIPGVKKRSHVDAILDALDIKLSREDIEMLDTISMKYVDMPFSAVVSRLVPGFFVKIVTSFMRGV